MARLEIGSRSTEEAVQPDGRFVIDLPPATAAVLVLTSGRTTALRLPIAPGEGGEARDLGELIAPFGQVVLGRLVRDEDLLPVAGARVWALRSADDPLLAWGQG